MERIKFNSPEEFAEAMLKYDLEGDGGYILSFDFKGYPENPYRFIIPGGRNEPINSGWANWQHDTFLLHKKPLFKHGQVVLCWGSGYNAGVHMRVWNADECKVYNTEGDGFQVFSNYKEYTGEIPEHIEKFIKSLEG